MFLTKNNAPSTVNRIKRHLPSVIMSSFLVFCRQFVRFNLVALRVTMSVGACKTIYHQLIYYQQRYRTVENERTERTI